MKHIWLALLLLMAGFARSAENISVGDVALAIPNPDEFSPVTPQMALLYELQSQFVPPTNQQFAAFIPARDVPGALKDEIPEMPRRFTVQTAKSLIGISVSTADFVNLKNTIKTQNEEVMKKIEAELPDWFEQLNKGMAKKFDVDPAFAISKMVPMPVHKETDRMLAYSALASYEMKDELGNPAPFVAAITLTFVHVKGTVLFLYSYAEESGLEWSKQASQNWADAVIAANPSDFQTSVKEAMPSAVAGIDWGQVGAKALAGGAIGLIIGLIGWAINRRKASE